MFLSSLGTKYCCGMIMKSVSELSVNDCCGCRACVQVCPLKCISFEEGADSFMVPHVDQNICVNCGKCVKVCSQCQPYIEFENKPEMKVYAARILDDNKIKQSSSGGIFTALAELVLDWNGYIVGCALNDRLEAEHIIVDNKKDLSKLRGSKYIQSNLGSIFSEVKVYLEKSNYVLFSGTGCQIASLVNFLGKNYDNLLTVDIICHGVPSQKLFSKYIGWLGRNKIINSYEFRNKDKKGWGYMSKYTLSERTFYEIPELDPYFNSFMAAKTYRECCYFCKYANSSRVSDISLGDYWGIEQEHPQFYTDKGVSLILVNSEKGRMLFEKISRSLTFIESTYEKAAKYNWNLRFPSERPMIRNEIYKEIDTLDFDQYVRKYLSVGFQLKARIKKIVPRTVKRTLKKILQ